MIRKNAAHGTCVLVISLFGCATESAKLAATPGTLKPFSLVVCRELSSLHCNPDDPRDCEGPPPMQGNVTLTFADRASCEQARTAELAGQCAERDVVAPCLGPDAQD